MGLFTVKIIKKNGTTLSPQLTPNSAAGGVFIFNDLGAGSYVVSYKLNDACNKYLYDTVVIDPYFYPNLNRSSAYQCDVSGFSVGAVASNGVGPFSYEIIGSTPALPSIIASPQASPIFSIDNGTNYSLIRLRALDACGNATLGDASILPLANYKIIADSNCFQSSSTLSVDTIYNSTYAWYKKDNYSSTDSTYLGAGYNVRIPFLSASDTGTYVCHVTVNTGCVKRSYVYNLTGLCYSILPVHFTSFAGKFINDHVMLDWNTGKNDDLRKYIVERRNSFNVFTEIGRVSPKPDSAGIIHYNFKDSLPAPGKNYYRLKLIYNDKSFTYSNTVMLVKNKKGSNIHCYPNPVSNLLMIDFEGLVNQDYKVILLNMLNQGVWESTFNTGNSNTMRIQRPQSVGKGIYVLKCINLKTNEEFSEKVIFL
jgi:hypothetical protein